MQFFLTGEGEMQYDPQNQPRSFDYYIPFSLKN
jgi:hypothetical protein